MVFSKLYRTISCLNFFVAFFMNWNYNHLLLNIWESIRVKAVFKNQIKWFTNDWFTKLEHYNGVFIVTVCFVHISPLIILLKWFVVISKEERVFVWISKWWRQYTIIKCCCTLIAQIIINPFASNAPFLYPLKTWEKPFCFLIFSGVKEREHWERIG